jgi:hypothetical protein
MKHLKTLLLIEVIKVEILMKIYWQTTVRRMRGFNFSNNNSSSREEGEEVNRVDRRDFLI